MKQKLSTKAKIIISIIVVFVLVLGGTAYWAANRFLIEHVELDLSEEVPASNQAVGDNGVENTPIEEPSATAAEVVTPTGEPSATALAATPTGEPSATAKADLATPKPSLSKQKVTSSTVKKEDAAAKDAGPEKYTATDMSYTSDSKTINIKKVVNGEGKNIVTYYAADIKLTDATQMKSAFAKNKFGLNIIEGTSVIAKDNDAILAINGDYYGFREDGIEIRNGRLFRNKPARTGLAFYKDGSMKIYDEKQTTGEELLKNGVWNTISFGPTLLNGGNMGTELATYEVDTNVGNHPIQGLQPRSGIGMIDKNHFVFVVVDGRSKESRGVQLEEFAKIFQDLGCTTAYNIDGGGSATMYFMGNRLNNPCGKNKERGTSDIIYIK